ncbi:MAG: hypothetical protein V1912_11405 [bacterium]
MRIHVDVTGLTGLVMHNGRLADPLDPLAIELSRLTDKRNRTEEEEREISDFEWLASLYYEKGLGTYIPAENIVRCLRDAATVWKLGEAVYDFVHVSTDLFTADGAPVVPVKHDGPADPRKLQKEDAFRLRKTVKIGRNRTPRTRPIFRTWGMSFDIDLDDTDLNLSDFERIAERAGRLEGIGTARKLGYGRFAATLSVAA